MFWTAFMLGLAGSLHCVGMCGPIALALPFSAADRWRMVGQSAIYHAGRIATYAALGLLFGLLGKGIEVAGFQKVMSISAGLFMVGMAFFSSRWESAALTLPGFSQVARFVQAHMGKMLRRRSQGAVFGVGMLNGLLPCGMVYMAVAGAITTTSGWEGSAYMAFFGLGTLPLMLAVTAVGRAASLQVRQKLRAAQPILLGAVGILLILRGLHLDLSLFESAVPKAGLDCH